MFPGFSDQATYSFTCPGELDMKPRAPVEEQAFSFQANGTHITELNVKAKLKYRKIDQFLVNYLFGPNSGITTPITIVSEDSAKIVVQTPKADISSIAIHPEIHLAKKTQHQ
jgi:hypothetical protein